MKYFSMFFILTAMSISIPFAYAEKINHDVKEIKTSAGLLHIEGEWNNEPKVFLDKKHLNFVGKDVAMSFFEERFTLPDRSEVIVIFDCSGGSMCPGVYKFLTVKGKNLTYSGKAGNCSDLPKFEQKGDVIIVSFPTNRPSKKDRWRYENGKVTEVK